MKSRQACASPWTDRYGLHLRHPFLICKECLKLILVILNKEQPTHQILPKAFCRIQYWHRISQKCFLEFRRWNMRTDAEVTPKVCVYFASFVHMAPSEDRLHLLFLVQESPRVWSLPRNRRSWVFLPFLMHSLEFQKVAFNRWQQIFIVTPCMLSSYSIIIPTTAHI